MVNRVQLIGRIGKEPEAKTTSGGKQLANISLATDNGFGDNKKTDWHRLTFWEKQADFVSKYLHKGDLIYVEGRIEYSTTGEGDSAKHFTNIIVSQVRSLSQGSSHSQNQSTGTAAAAAPALEDIPF